MNKFPKTYINAPGPDYTYIFRWWLTEEDDPAGTQSQVVVIRSPLPLMPQELQRWLETMGCEPSQFELIDVPSGSAAVLDTWERFITTRQAPGLPKTSTALIYHWCDLDRAKRIETGDDHEQTAN